MLIFVEGPTDKDFIELYTEYLGLSEIEVISTNGKDNLKNFKPKIKNETKIIFDADKNIEDSLQNIKEKLGNELFLKCEVFLMPNNKDNGDLETLLEKIAREVCILKCFDNYKECIQKIKDTNQDIYLPAKKSKVFAYLESFGFKNGVNNFKINGDMIDCESEYLQPLKNFLLDIKD